MTDTAVHLDPETIATLARAVARELNRSQEPAPVPGTECIALAEAAERMGVGRSTLYHAIQDDPESAAAWGAAKIGGRVIIRRAIFERFMASGSAESPESNPFLVRIDRRAS